MSPVVLVCARLRPCSTVHGGGVMERLAYICKDGRGLEKWFVKSRCRAPNTAALSGNGRETTELFLTRRRDPGVTAAYAIPPNPEVA